MKEIRSDEISLNNSEIYTPFVRNAHLNSTLKWIEYRTQHVDIWKFHLKKQFSLEVQNRLGKHALAERRNYSFFNRIKTLIDKIEVSITARRSP